MASLPRLALVTAALLLGPGAVRAQGEDASSSRGGGAWTKVLTMPDLSAVGRFAVAYDSYDVATLSPREGPQGPAGEPAFLFQELELGLGAVIDPYFRGDVFISFSPSGVSVEEAYLTTLELPAGLQVKAGRFFSPLGRFNTTHPHTWDFADAPLPRGRLVASEVLAGPGADLLWLAPLPWFVELQAAFQSTDPYDSGTERLTATARLGQFFTLGEATTVGLGFSAARRDEGGEVRRNQLAVDLLLKYRPLAGRAYLAVTGELHARRFTGGTPVATAPGDGTDGNGGWLQAVVRQDAWWSYGLRYERAPAAGLAAPGTEQRLAGVANWYLSEFSRLALQLAWEQRPGGAQGFESILHLEFVMGAHGAHPF